MDILIYHAKHGDIYYAANGQEQMLKAYGAIFKEMDKQGDYECCPPETKQEKELYKKAKKGDLHATRIFLIGRREYEYENITVDKVNIPE